MVPPGLLVKRRNFNVAEIASMTSGTVSDNVIRGFVGVREYQFAHRPVPWGHVEQSHW